MGTPFASLQWASTSTRAITWCVILHGRGGRHVAHVAIRDADRAMQALASVDCRATGAILSEVP